MWNCIILWNHFPVQDVNYTDVAKSYIGSQLGKLYDSYNSKLIRRHIKYSFSKEKARGIASFSLLIPTVKPDLIKYQY